MKRLLTLIFIISCTLSSLSISAQDVHFSQFYAAPLTINPALTGKFNGDWRIAGIYRNQWPSITNSLSKPVFSTPSLSLDLSLFKGKLKGDALGLGIVLIQDGSNGGQLKTFRAGLSAAYHMGLGANNKTMISLGLQGGYTQKSYDAANIIFADQYTQGGGSINNPNSTSIEPGLNDNISYIDFNAGLLFNTKFGKKTTFWAGYSLSHIGTPEEKFVDDLSNTLINDLPMRNTAHAGVEVDLTNKIVLIPGALYQNQNKAQEFNYGVTAGYHLNAAKSTTVYLGAWHRWDDAVILKGGLDFKKMRLGIAYDFTHSSLRDAKNSQNNTSLKGPSAFEISLSYIGNVFQPKDDVYLFNPRF